MQQLIINYNALLKRSAKRIYYKIRATDNSIDENDVFQELAMEILERMSEWDNTKYTEEQCVKRCIKQKASTLLNKHFSETKSSWLPETGKRVFSISNDGRSEWFSSEDVSNDGTVCEEMLEDKNNKNIRDIIEERELRKIILDGLPKMPKKVFIVKTNPPQRLVKMALEEANKNETLHNISEVFINFLLSFGLECFSKHSNFTRETIISLSERVRQHVLAVDEIPADEFLTPNSDQITHFKFKVFEIRGISYQTKTPLKDILEYENYKVVRITDRLIAKYLGVSNNTLITSTRLIRDRFNQIARRIGHKKINDRFAITSSA